MTAHGMDGKGVIITAGASGIGRAVAERFASRGARVAVCDIDQPALDGLDASNLGISTWRCDVADPAAVETVLAEMASHLGAVDVLMNNAGSAGPTASIEDIAPADWTRTIDINLASQFLFIRGVVPLMKARRDGVIINMSSAAGRLGMPLRTPYAAAKWAVVGLTQSLAMELGAHNIRVNAILPGSVRGQRMDRVLQARAVATGRSFDEIVEEEVASISLGRMIEPEEIADLAVYLASPSGRSISGQSLGVCGNTEILR